MAHADWRGDNLRVDASGADLVAVYDCDSLRADREAIALGEVAAMHSVDWSGPGDPYFATADECVEFVAAVERARRAAFTAAEWRALQASIVYGWCYTARCEHARAAVGDDKPAPTRWSCHGPPRARSSFTAQRPPRSRWPR